MQGAWFRVLQQSAAGVRGPFEVRGPWHSAIVTPTKDGPEHLASLNISIMDINTHITVQYTENV